MNKDIEYYLGFKYDFNIKQEPDVYRVTFPELPGCVAYSETLKGIQYEIKEAKKEWFATCIEEDIPIPLPASRKRVLC